MSVQQNSFFCVFIIMKPDFTHLVNACSKYDSDAQRQLYEMFAPNMLALCMNYTGSKSDAEDVLHDGFVRIFEKIHTLRNPELLPAWVKQIMKNCAISYVSKKRKKGLLLIDEVADADDELWCDDELEYRNFDKDDIFEAIQQLPEAYKVVFIMREIDGCDFEEISRTVKAPQTTVRSLLCRSKKKIKQYLLKI